MVQKWDFAVRAAKYMGLLRAWKENWTLSLPLPSPGTMFNFRCRGQQQTRSPACQQAPCCSAMLLPLDLIMESLCSTLICKGRKKLHFFAYRRLKPTQWKLCTLCEPLPIGANTLLSRRDDFDPPGVYDPAFDATQNSQHKQRTAESSLLEASWCFSRKGLPWE